MMYFYMVYNNISRQKTKMAKISGGVFLFSIILKVYLGGVII